MEVDDRVRARGFTLVEVLVVVMLIGVLAMLALPVFLQQRERAYAAQVQHALRNMATAQGAYFSDAGNTGYAATVAELEAQGFRYSDAVVPEVVWATDSAYCLRARSAADPSVVLFYGVPAGGPSAASCA